ncbi:hypothetical protein CEXT_190341 [Caerostris extrusa]|uniref:Uncharacterized protein n=1 Tax=Caerostris extrusa TaxID=172846 RepID=A0AAV4PQB2_CAEEX|nr:hypothetical protein CEXT_190341 [Caerostris extrusa]
MGCFGRDIFCSSFKFRPSGTSRCLEVNDSFNYWILSAKLRFINIEIRFGEGGEVEKANPKIPLITQDIISKLQ